MSDVNPAKIHVTVPASYRTHRVIPSLYVLHREGLAAVDQASFEGIPVVSAAKAVRQAHEQHLRRSLLEQAIDDGVQSGWLRLEPGETAAAVLARIEIIDVAGEEKSDADFLGMGSTSHRNGEQGGQ